MAIKCIALLICVMLNIINVSSQGTEVVRLKLFYEVFCPGSRQLHTIDFNKTITDLQNQLHISTYPYGNAQTIDNGDGTYSFKCQHGPGECYGNMLHACALDHLASQENNLGIFFNSCMMDKSQADYGSDDAAADKCGEIMNIDSKPIKECAKGARGKELLKYHGDESKKQNFRYVPYPLINEIVWNFKDDYEGEVCKAFKEPPPQCKD